MPPYIGGQWEECCLHWWSMGRTHLILVVSEKNVPYIVGQWEEYFYIVVTGKNAPYISSQWEECPFLWWSVRRILLTLGVSGQNPLH
ncbi:unnamed protein product, partial [Staurois parvus]